MKITRDEHKEKLIEQADFLVDFMREEEEEKFSYWILSLKGEHPRFQIRVDGPNTTGNPENMFVSMIYYTLYKHYTWNELKKIFTRDLVDFTKRKLIYSAFSDNPLAVAHYIKDGVNGDFATKRLHNKLTHKDQEAWSKFMKDIRK